MAQQGPPPRRPSRHGASGRPDVPDDLNTPGRPEGTGRHGRGSHRAPSLDDQPDLDGYGDAGQPGYGEAGPPGYVDPPPEYGGGQPEYGDPQPEYQDPRPDYGDMRPEYAGTRPEYEAPGADYEGAGHDRSRPRVAERRGGAARPARGGPRGSIEREIWDRDPFSEGDESEVPPWAGPSIYATRAGGRRMGPATEEQAAAELEAGVADGAGSGPAPRRRGLGRGRAAAARLRKSRRRVYILCGSAIVVAVIIAVVAVIVELPSPKPKSDFINSLQPGEFKAVPNACTAVSASVLSQNLAGSGRRVTPTGSGGTSSQCSFTVDHPPVFRVLQITVEAFQPSLVVAGNGSATAGAVDAYASARLALASPAKKSPLPKAAITSLTGLGQEAVSALQILHHGRTVDDLFTVVARERNVLITVTMEAQARGGGYGPVSQPTVASGTQAVARAVMAKAQTEPTVKS